MQEMDKVMSQYDAFLSPAPEQREPDDHQPDRPSGHRAQVRLHRQHARVDHGDGHGCYDEATMCRVALAYERATDWHKKHPTTLGAKGA